MNRLSRFVLTAFIVVVVAACASSAKPTPNPARLGSDPTVHGQATVVSRNPAVWRIDDFDKGTYFYVTVSPQSGSAITPPQK